MNIGSGYLAMLVAMTYSVELFICMVIGLVLGHAIFNTGKTLTSCCQTSFFIFQKLLLGRVLTLAVLLRQLDIQMMPNSMKLKIRNKSLNMFRFHNLDL